jgi:hypothetical protein
MGRKHQTLRALRLNCQATGWKTGFFTISACPFDARRDLPLEFERTFELKPGEETRRAVFLPLLTAPAPVIGSPFYD